MISKFFSSDVFHNNNENCCRPCGIEKSREIPTVHNITSVAIPKYCVRNNFIEYVIECSTRNKKWRVFRRYQQFKALDKKLKQLCTRSSQHHCEYGVLPVLSGSHWVGVTNHSIDLVEKRRRYLEIYLEQILVPKNLFYVAKTALYDFLHDGEVPVEFETNRHVCPLLGFSLPAPFVWGGKEDMCEDGALTAVEKAIDVVKSPFAFGGDICAEKNNKFGNEDITEGDVDNKNQTCGSSNKNSNKQEFVAHAEDKEALDKIALAPSFSSSSSSSSLCEQQFAIRGSAKKECEDAPSGEDTDGYDVRKPRPSPLCLYCNAEFSSVLYPHKCRLCKNFFCRNCLHVLEEPKDDMTAKACVQCYENYKRHKHNEPSGKNIAVESLCFFEKNQLGTDVSLRDFRLITTLGRGTFGRVIKVIFNKDNKVYAMKIMNKLAIYKRHMTDCIKEEKNIMETLPPHPFIVKCHFAFQTDYHLFFILDYLPGGDLYSHLYPKCLLSQTAICVIIAEIVLALEHLHRNDVVHRDLKPENIVLGADGFIKITDFGLAKMNFSSKRHCSFVGSPEYVAPETIQGDYQTRALDWWSLGVMLYEMLKGSPPFHAGNNYDIYNNVLSRQLDFKESCFSDEAVSLIQQLLHRQPKQRLIYVENIKSHPYFATINWDALEKKIISSQVKIDLYGNDTKYFKRKYTAEWAVIFKKQETLDEKMRTNLTTRFSNFVYVTDAVNHKEKEKENTANSEKNITNLKVNKPHLELLLSSTSKVDATMSINPQGVIGLWRLLKVELTAIDGRVSYPWGGDVCGFVAYFANGMYTMQLSTAHGRHLRGFVGEDKLTNEDFADMFNSYVASFGKYRVNVGGNVIVHCPFSSLCPSFTRRIQKYFIEVIDGEKKDNEGGGEDMSVFLRLSTAVYKVQEDKLFARTVLTWEKVGFCLN